METLTPKYFRRKFSDNQGARKKIHQRERNLSFDCTGQAGMEWDQNARDFQLDQTDPHCNSSSLFTAMRRRGLKGRKGCSCSYGVGVGAGGGVEKTLL